MIPNPIHRHLQAVLFLFTILLAGALRLSGLGDHPYGLFRDEAEKGYNAWALATTGGAVDFSGGIGSGPPIAWRRLPWMINVMGGKTSAIYQYAAVPMMWLGGLNITTTRLPAALVGTLTVALLGWLAWAAWGGWAGVAAALVLALSPWHINFSRWAAEGIFVPLFVVLTLGGLLGMEHRRRWGAPLAGAALGWLFYSYSGAQPFVLAWGVCLAVLYGRLIKGKKWPLWLGLALFLIPVIPTLIVRLGPGGSSRLGRVAIWSEAGATPLGVAWTFLKNYCAHFDPRFLFLSGDHQPRHNVAGSGELLLPDLVFLAAGLVIFFSRGKGPLRGALLTALACAPLPAAITREGIPHALRAFAMVVPLALWTGLGLSGICWLVYEKIRLSKDARPVHAPTLVTLLVTGYLVVGGYIHFYKQYWSKCTSNPAVQVAFEAGERNSWERVASRLRPQERVFVNGNIPYVPYYQAFFFRLNPRQVAAQGMEPARFVYFDPQQMTPQGLEQIMRTGDWTIQGAPAAMMTLPDGRPLLAPEKGRNVNEAWVWATQK